MVLTATLGGGPGIREYDGPRSVEHRLLDLDEWEELPEPETEPEPESEVESPSLWQGQVRAQVPPRRLTARQRAAVIMGSVAVAGLAGGAALTWWGVDDGCGKRCGSATTAKLIGGGVLLGLSGSLVLAAIGSLTLDRRERGKKRRLPRVQWRTVGMEF